MAEPLVAWVVAMMVLLQPRAPWRDGYEDTARGIVAGARRSILFDGPTGLERTLALDVALAWFESRFDTHANGDHGSAHGLYQVHAPEAEGADAQTTAANNMIRASFRVCHGRPVEEMLGWYAAGGPDCNRGLKESRHRVWRAQWLMRKLPPPAIDVRD